VSNRQEESDSAPGQDSFLDVVANLVGILIILVMVVGVGAKKAFMKEIPLSIDAAAEMTTHAATVKAKADAIQNDIYQIARDIDEHQLEIDYRQSERDRMLLYITAAERAVGNEKQKLDSQQQRQIDVRGELARLQAELDETQRARDTVANEGQPVSVIEHLPTPMAKTVFGKELHFRLMAGRLTYVPWDDLVERLKNEAKQKLWKLKDANVITEEAGPIGGFRIRYRLKKVDYPIETKVGTMVRQSVELDFFEFVPVTDDLGEPVEAAAQADSQFQTRLATEDAENTTITVWVYPDSFNHFHTLKSQLYKQGFLTAARPMPADRFMGGSPRGTRSAAE
jgi:hypothetical protein